VRRSTFTKYSSTLPKPAGWMSFKRIEDEINGVLSTAEGKLCDPNGGVCRPRTVGLLVRRHIAAGRLISSGKGHPRAGQVESICP